MSTKQSKKLMQYKLLIIWIYFNSLVVKLFGSVKEAKFFIKKKAAQLKEGPCLKWKSEILRVNVANAYD